MPEYPGADNENVLDVSCKSEDAPVEPDVAVDVSLDARFENEWARIPVTEVEAFINRDGPADLNRTAKVTFPGEWGNESVAQYIEGLGTDDTFRNPSTGEITELGDSYNVARVWFRDQVNDQYQIVHYGYVGGIGPAAESSGLFKMWVYDPSDLLRGIEVSKSFEEPTPQQVMNFVLQGEDDQGRIVGLERRSVFDRLFVSVLREEDLAEVEADLTASDLIESAEDDSGPSFSTGVLDDAFEIVVNSLPDILGSGKKRFQRNRHNLVDVMNWLTEELGGKWHFEPSAAGPVLTFDWTGLGKSVARRRFRATELPDDEDTGPFSDMGVLQEVDQLENDALFDIKPFNTLTVYGETTTSFDPSKLDEDTPTASAGAYSKAFPFVKVTYPPLLKRAGGYEYGPSAVDTEKTTLNRTRIFAIKEFRKHIEESTEGSIEVKGSPHIIPYDYFTAIPVCGDTYSNTDAAPLTYEVNSLKHHRKHGERYTTDLNVSLAFDGEALDIDAFFARP